MIFLLGCNRCISRMYTITGEEEKQEASGAEWGEQSYFFKERWSLNCVGLLMVLAVKVD